MPCPNPRSPPHIVELLDKPTDKPNPAWKPLRGWGAAEGLEVLNGGPPGPGRAPPAGQHPGPGGCGCGCWCTGACSPRTGPLSSCLPWVPGNTSLAAPCGCFTVRPPAPAHPDSSRPRAGCAVCRFAPKQTRGSREVETGCWTGSQPRRAQTRGPSSGVRGRWGPWGTGGRWPGVPRGPERAGSPLWSRAAPCAGLRGSRGGPVGDQTSNSLP